MKVFVAGATGTIGRRLVPLLVQAGHDVVGMSRDQERAGALASLGARGIVCDVYDRERLASLLASEAPDAIIDELSDLPRSIGPRGGKAAFAANRRIRTEGALNLVESAVAGGVARVIAQSYAHVYAPMGRWVKNEDEPLNLDPRQPEQRRSNVESVLELERIVLETPGIEGVALRYGAFYGPGTPFAADGSIAGEVRRGHYPIIGDGRGLTSFIHVDDAAAATVLALTGPPGVYNVCDDRPAMEKEWVPFYADLLGAQPPRHVFSFFEQAIGREHFVYRTLQQRGASNRRAREALGMTLCFPSWRQGFMSEASRERQAERSRTAA